MSLFAPQQNAATIENVAASDHVDPLLALATAIQESGWTLNNLAVGDNNTSFGLFQLHQGGELGNLTENQAFDPLINSQVAISEIAQVASTHPGWSPGQIAAAAQRPADPITYANDVNSIYQQLKSGNFNFGSSLQNPIGLGNPASNPINSIIKGATGFDPAAYTSNAAFNPAKLAPLFIGIIIVMIGLVVVLSDHQEVIETAMKAAK